VIRAHRYHDISAGHRVYGHESKCAHLHGHNYRVHFTIEAQYDRLDDVGRVLDFGVMKEVLCAWLEREWDHKTLIWDQDPWRHDLLELDRDGVVCVSFNPTAENMAWHLLTKVAPKLLVTRPAVMVTEVRVEETAKCHASARLNHDE